MKVEVLSVAKQLEERIRELELLKLYLSGDEVCNWWNDVLRLFLPKKLYNKLFDSDYDVYKSKYYDNIFVKDILDYTDVLIEKYKKELEKL